MVGGHNEYLVSFLFGFGSLFSACGLSLLLFFYPLLLGTFYEDWVMRAGKREHGGRFRLVRTLVFAVGFGGGFMLGGFPFSSDAGLAFWDVSGALARLGGVGIFIFGAHFMGFRWADFLVRGRLKGPNDPVYGQVLDQSGALIYTLAGAAFFALSWTPCPSRVLTSIQLLAGTLAGARPAALMLACFAGGMALFVFFAWCLLDFIIVSQLERPRRQKIFRRISGAVVCLVGVLIVWGRYGLTTVWSEVALDYVRSLF